MTQAKYLQREYVFHLVKDIPRDSNGAQERLSRALMPTVTAFRSAKRRYVVKCLDWYFPLVERYRDNYPEVVQAIGESMLEYFRTHPTASLGVLAKCVNSYVCTDEQIDSYFGSSCSDMGAFAERLCSPCIAEFLVGAAGRGPDVQEIALSALTAFHSAWRGSMAHSLVRQAEFLASLFFGLRRFCTSAEYTYWNDMYVYAEELACRRVVAQKLDEPLCSLFYELAAAGYRSGKLRTARNRAMRSIYFSEDCLLYPRKGRNLRLSVQPALELGWSGMKSKDACGSTGAIFCRDVTSFAVLNIDLLSATQANFLLHFNRTYCGRDAMLNTYRALRPRIKDLWSEFSEVARKDLTALEQCAA